MGRGGGEVVMTWGHWELSVNTLETEKQEEKQMSHDDDDIILASSMQVQARLMWCQTLHNLIPCQRCHSDMWIWHLVMSSCHHPITFAMQVMLITARTSTIDWPELGGLCCARLPLPTAPLCLCTTVHTTEKCCMICSRELLNTEYTHELSVVFSQCFVLSVGSVCLSCLC